MVKSFIALIKILIFLTWMLVMMPTLIVVHYTKFLCPCYNRLYFKVVCFILGIKPKVISGQPPIQTQDKKKILCISNHSSFLDIIAIGSVLKVDFISKKDVKNWPLFGIIFRLGNTIFISRNKMDAKNQIDIIEEAFETRKIPLMIFPEGTTSNGNEVLPFKSAMFSIFEEYFEGSNKDPIIIQPISIAYLSHNGTRLNAEERSGYAWYIKEQGFFPNFWKGLRKMPLEIGISFHAPIDIKNFKNRKELALYCHDIVANGFFKLLGEKNVK